MLLDSSLMIAIGWTAETENAELYEKSVDTSVKLTSPWTMGTLQRVTEKVDKKNIKLDPGIFGRLQK